jgi:hypothetical protein
MKDAPTSASDAAEDRWESSLRDYKRRPGSAPPNNQDQRRFSYPGNRRKAPTMTYLNRPTMTSRPPLVSNVTDKVLQSLVAQAEDEVDSIKAYCRQLVAESVADLSDQFTALDSTVAARLAVVEDSVANVEHELQTLQAEREHHSPSSLANLFSTGQLNLETVLMKLETLIAGLLDDMGRQGKELASWRSKFRELCVSATLPHCRTSKFTHSPPLPSFNRFCAVAWKSLLAVATTMTTIPPHRLKMSSTRSINWSRSCTASSGSSGN